MKIVDILKLTNKYLSGEQLTYNKLLPFLDAVIDDINNELNSTYPSFSQLETMTHSDVYDFFFYFFQRLHRICNGNES